MKTMNGAKLSCIYKPFRTLLVGGDGIPLETFLSRPVDSWLRE